MKLSTRNPVPIAERLLARKSFNTHGSLCGIAKPVWFDHGKMSISDYDLLRTDSRTIGVDYVVYSYTTPIAWLRGDGQWFMPVADYSATTTRHKNTIRAAIQEYKKALNNA